jgi:glycosyltransferase involved in cell wall biosynthesis
LEPEIPWPADPGEIKIVYTGAVYHAHYDAFHNLLVALQEIGRPEIKLHLYTAQTNKLLEEKQMIGQAVYHEHLPLSQVREVQEQADILFLPLAFKSPIVEVIKTSAPAKLGEYMATGRPILVHAPQDSFLSWYFKRHECGLVVDRSEPARLVQAIRRILEDSALRRQLKTNAMRQARTDFSLEASRAEFFKLFSAKVKAF